MLEGKIDPPASHPVFKWALGKTQLILEDTNLTSWFVVDQYHIPIPLPTLKGKSMKSLKVTIEKLKNAYKSPNFLL